MVRESRGEEGPKRKSLESDSYRLRRRSSRRSSTRHRMETRRLQKKAQGRERRKKGVSWH